MQTFLSNIAQHLKLVYQKAEGFIEDERQFPVSEVFLNATFQRFVTDNVKILKDLHADLHDEWMRLYASVDVKGMQISLSVDLKILKMVLNNKQQLIVFEQISQTQILHAHYPNTFYQWGVKAALFYYHKILKQDPLGPLLQRFEVLTVQDELLYLDLNRWLDNKRSIIDSLSKVNINHAVLRETELLVSGNVNLAAVMNKMSAETVAQQYSDEIITPIKQK